MKSCFLNFIAQVIFVEQIKDCRFGKREIFTSISYARSATMLCTRPNLIFVFINDLTEHIKSNLRLFADDTAVYLAISDLEHA